MWHFHLEMVILYQNFTDAYTNNLLTDPEGHIL